MKQNFERQIMYRLILFMLIVTSCSDNKAEGYEPQTPFGKDIATTSIVSEMFWDRIFWVRRFFQASPIFYYLWRSDLPVGIF